LALAEHPTNFRENLEKKSAASDFFLQDDDALKKITIDWEGKKGSLAAE